MNIKERFYNELSLLPTNGHLKWEALSDEHTNYVVSWRNNIENRQYFESQNPINSDTQREFLKNYDNYDRIDLVLFYEENPIGVFNIKNLNSYPEYGALIGDPNYRGKGIGAFAKKSIMKLWFEVLKQEYLFFKNRKDNHLAVTSNLNKSFDVFKEDEYYITFRLDRDKYMLNII